MSETPRENTEPAPAEPAIEGVAVELPGEVMPVAPVPMAPAPPLSAAAPVVPPPSPSPAASPTAEAVGSAFDGHAAEPPMNPLGDIAAERPEILVGAAFAGGILAAMILRRLGS